MTSLTILRRREDGKLFKVAFLGHWSDIVSDDGETDTIKWFGASYVSIDRGYSYSVFDPDVSPPTMPTTVKV